MRQLVQHEYDASGPWRGPGQRKWDWPSTLGRSCRAVRMLGYCTRTAKRSRPTRLLHIEQVRQGLYVDPGRWMYEGNSIRAGACMQVQVAVQAYKV